MKKRLILILFTIVSLLPLSAFSVDAAFSWGPAVMNFKTPGVSVAYGFNLGVSKRSELSLWGTSTLTPAFFGENYCGLEYDFSLLGVRSTGSKVAGSGINMLIGGGIIASMNNPYDVFMPTDIFITLTPFTLGNPILERRERFCKLMLSYNPFENKVGVYMNLLLFDYYFFGSWKSYD